MSNFFIAFLCGISFATWLFMQLNRRNGNANGANNAIAAGASGLVVILVVFVLLNAFVPKI